MTYDPKIDTLFILEEPIFPPVETHSIYEGYRDGSLADSPLWTGTLEQARIDAQDMVSGTDPFWGDAYKGFVIIEKF